jgi:hypothetical protein
MRCCNAEVRATVSVERDRLAVDDHTLAHVRAATFG